MEQGTIKIGTRGSKLALYQAEKVKLAINRNFPDALAEIVIIKTKGDKILDTALSKIGDKGLFTRELELALLDHKIDVAVHSLKDMPTELPENLQIGAVLERGLNQDALVSKSNKKLHQLNGRDVIATSSLRRKASLLHYNPDFQIIDIRGNVHTRIRKMNDGHCDAIIMAAAGLTRLGLDELITEMISPDIIIPAVSQGAIAVETRINDEKMDLVLTHINHKETYRAVMAERTFLQDIEGGCQVPAGCFTELAADRISLTGFISSVDGKTYIRKKAEGSIGNAVNIGKNLAKQLLESGGREILKQIR